jgi:hypothetical protein
VAWIAAGALAFAAVGASAQEGPTATAVVVASATLAAPVGIEVPAGLALERQASGLTLQGVLAVRSPAPHVLSASVLGWGGAEAKRFAPVLRGSWQGTPQEVRVVVGEGHGGTPVRVTYVVAVIL